MRILCLYGGPSCYMGNFIEALSKYAEVSGANIFTNNEPELPYEIDIPKFNKINNNTGFTEDDYDFVIGLDNGTISVVSLIAKNLKGNLKAGVHLLDYPTHTFKKNKDYVPSNMDRWSFWKEELKDLDFVLHCRQNVQDDLKEELKGIPNTFHLLPCKVINHDNYDRKDYIVYSGAINPTKGVHHIINALSILEDKPLLRVIGNGYNLSDYANFLKVPYEQMGNISEEKKFKMYHECRFLVYAHDTGVIPGLSILEGIGVGRTGICFDFPEHKLMYKHHAIYCQPNHISLANSIKHFRELGFSQTDKHAENGPEFVEKNASFDSWAKNTIRFLEEL